MKAIPIMGDKFLAIPSIRQQLMMDRKIAPATMEWWHDQVAEASDHWVHPNGVLSVYESLGKLRESTQGMRVWAHGICFDIGNLESLYRAIGHEPPWRFSDVRDSRTVQRLFAPRRDPPDLGTITHDPVADCVKQVWDLWSRWPAVPAE